MDTPNIQIIDGYEYIPYQPESYPEEAMIQRSAEFYQAANARRSVRFFSDKNVPLEVMLNIIRTAGTSPSGANKQPWTFCLVSNPEIKKEIRKAAEREEYKSYHSRMSKEWLEDLKPMGTNWEKPFLETAPWLIAVFRKIYDTDATGMKKNNYYVTESLGLACGMLLMAIHHAGLSALTHTPSPMNFLSDILGRPENEKPFLLIPVGYAAANALVPNIPRKKLEKICVIYD